MEEFDIDPWLNLANAIVAQAAHDYAQAVVDADEHAQKHFLHFFHSEWFKTLTSADPDYLLANVKRGGEEFKAEAEAYLERWATEIPKPVDAFKCPLCGFNVRARHTTFQRYHGNFKQLQSHYNTVKCTWCELTRKHYLYSIEREKRNYGKERRERNADKG